MVMSFAKGLAVGWKTPLIPITIFDIARVRLKRELDEGRVIRLGHVVGKNRWIVVESKSNATMAPSQWIQMSEEEAQGYLQGDVPGFIILSNQLTSAYNSSHFDICFAEEMLRSDIAEPPGYSDAFSPARISQIEPDYGLVFSALTTQEQQKYRRSL
jgi:tRNA A37 threonylcarbamoyladenosine modification protein TsaB